MSNRLHDEIMIRIRAMPAKGYVIGMSAQGGEMQELSGVSSLNEVIGFADEIIRESFIPIPAQPPPLPPKADIHRPLQFEDQERRGLLPRFMSKLRKADHIEEIADE